MTSPMNKAHWKRVGWLAWNVAAAMSLLLCLATLAIWVRSYWVRDTLGFGWNEGNCHVAQSILGRVQVLTRLGGGCQGGATYSADRLSPNALWHGGMSGYPQPAEIRWRLGFVWQSYFKSHFAGGDPFVTSNRLIVVPYWAPVCGFALAPVAWAAGFRRRVGVLDVMIIVAAVALALATPALLARSMIESGARGE